MFSGIRRWTARHVPPRSWRVATTCFAVVVLIVALLTWAAPPLLKPVLEDRLSTALARKVTIDELAINPLALSLTFRDVVVHDSAPGAPLLALGELRLNAEAASLWHWAPVLSEVRVVRPAVHLQRTAANRYNVSDLIERVLQAPAGPPARFSVSNITVADGRIDFDDAPEAQKHEITDIAIGVPFISSLPVDVDVKVQPSLSAIVNGRGVEVRGETRPFRDTHETRLHWESSEIPIARYLGYVPAELPVRVTAGTLDASLDLIYLARGKDLPELDVSGMARVNRLVVEERSGSPLLRVASATMNLERLEPLLGRAAVASIALDAVEVNVHRDATGAMNLGALADQNRHDNGASARGADRFRFRLGSLSVTNGRVQLLDEAVSPAVSAMLDDVTLTVSELSNEPGHSASVALAFLTDARESVRHEGSVVLEPLSLEGHLEAGGLDLKRLFPYYGSALNLVVDDGTLDLATDVHFTAAPSAFALSNLEGTARNLTLRLPEEKQPLWRIPSLAVAGASVDASKHSLRFETIEGHGAKAVVRRNAQGAINFARLVKAPDAAKTQSSDDEAWQLSAGRIALDGVGIDYVDETMKPATTISLTSVVAVGENLSNVKATKGRLDVRARVNKRGSLALAGPFASTPPAGTLHVVARDIDLPPFQLYVHQLAGIVVTRGAASGRGTLEFSARDPSHAAFKGDLMLDDVVTLDEATKNDLVNWNAIALRNVDAASEPLKLAIGDIAIDGLHAGILLDETGKLNLQNLARSSAPSTSPPETGAPPPQAIALQSSSTGLPWLSVGRISVSSSSIDFADHFIRPNYSANITDLAGSISSLSFEQPAEVELRGNVQRTAPLQISGRMNPLARNLFLDLNASAHEIQLPPLTPYSAKYVGYGIEKGTLSMKVHYRVQDRKLSADNSIVLNQLTFGSRVESPDAIKVPVLLAVALLKDRNGVIDFDLPVGGSLDDPEFSVGGLVVRAIVNLFVKVVTSPFALLSKLGGHHEELAFIEFPPGSASLDAAAQAKIDALGKALGERPGLKLDIAGRVDRAVDAAAMKHASMERKVRVQKFQDLERARQAPPSVDAVQVAADEYEALLRRAVRAETGLPRDVAAKVKDMQRAELEAMLQSLTVVADEDLRDLAYRRADAVRDRLASQSQLPADRVLLVAPKLDASDIKDGGKTTRVDFALR